MHLLRFNPENKTLREVPPSEFAADPACRYFYVQGKRAAVPIATPDGIGEIVWQHPDYQPPSPANAMSDQHQHRATPEQWATTERMGAGDHATSSCLLELRDLVKSVRDSALHLALVTSKLGHRVKALEATQHAHIEAKAAEAGARCAVEQLRSTPGSWQPIRTFTADEVAPVVVPTAEPASGARQLTLVERVALAINPKPDENPIFLYKDEARAAIREVAAWLRENPGPNSAWPAVARDLMYEANH